MAAGTEEVELDILRFCNRGGAQGVPMRVLKEYCEKKFGVAGFRGAMQKLVRVPPKVQLVNRNGENHVVIRAGAGRSSMKEAKLKDLNEIERAAYQLILDTDTKGMYLKALIPRLRSSKNATDQQVSRAIQRLQTEELIKPVRSKERKTQKMFIAFHLDPDESVTGGAWYAEDGSFDKEFVQALYRAVHQTVMDQEMTNLQFIERKLSEAQVSKKALTTAHVQMVVDILVYDGKIQVVADGNNLLYQTAKQLTDWNSFTETPCVTCPKMSQCGIAAPRFHNPQTCPYLSAWLRDESNESTKLL